MRNKLQSALYLGICALLLTGCATTTTGPIETACAITEIEWSLTLKAELKNFQCRRDKDAALLFTTGIENSTGQPLRYRLSVVLPDLKMAAGHLVPRKGEPPVVNPGETESATLVFTDIVRWPEKAEVTLIVLPEQSEISEE